MDHTTGSNCGPRGSSPGLSVGELLDLTERNSGERLEVLLSGRFRHEARRQIRTAQSWFRMVAGNLHGSLLADCVRFAKQFHQRPVNVRGVRQPKVMTVPKTTEGFSTNEPRMSNAAFQPQSCLGQSLRTTAPANRTRLCITIRVFCA